MRALGAKGGRQSVRSRLAVDDSLADHALRQKAKRRLEALLDSNDESKRLAAARALYSYSAARPPTEPVPATSPTVQSKSVSINGLLRVWLLEGQGILDDPETQRIVIEAHGRIPDVQQAVERFTQQVERLRHGRTLLSTNEIETTAESE